LLWGSWFPPRVSRTTAVVRHRFGCIWSLLTNDRIVRPSRNLLTALRALREVWISQLPWHSAERVEDGRDH